jgi:hypothetical protein
LTFLTSAFSQRSFNDVVSDEAYFEDDDDDEDTYGPPPPEPAPIPTTKAKPKGNYFQGLQSNLSKPSSSANQKKPAAPAPFASLPSSLSLIADLYDDFEQDELPEIASAPSQSPPQRSSEEEFDSLTPLRSKFLSDDDGDDDFAHVFLRTSPHQSNAVKTTNKSSHGANSSGNGSSAGISFRIMNKKQVSFSPLFSSPSSSLFSLCLPLSLYLSLSLSLTVSLPLSVSVSLLYIYYTNSDYYEH